MIAAAVLAFLSGAPLEVVGYLPDYRLPAFEASSARGVDRVIYAGPTPREDGGLDAIPAEDLAVLRRVRDQSGAELMVCVGGWDKDAAFRAAVATPESRARLLRTLRPVLGGRPFTGVVFDWEYPVTETDNARYAALLREASALGRVEVAVSPWKLPSSDALEAATRVHLMSYDHAFPQATLEKTAADLAAVKALPSEKLLLGLPFYGRSADRTASTAADLLAAEPGLRGDVSATGSAFNNAATLRAKVRLASEQELAGVMIWELGQDAAGERALLRAVLDERGRLAASGGNTKAENE